MQTKIIFYFLLSKTNIGILYQNVKFNNKLEYKKQTFNVRRLEKNNIKMHSTQYLQYSQKLHVNVAGQMQN